MASFDDEDDPPRFDDKSARARSRRRERREDSGNDGAPDAADLAPDDLGTVRCGECRKLILEGSVRCPYCKHPQLEQEQGNKSLWFILTAVICMLLIGGYFILGAFGIVAKFHQ